MNQQKQTFPSPDYGSDCGCGFCRVFRSVLFRFFLIACIALYSFPGTRTTQILVHDHHEIDDVHLVEMHTTPEPHHDDHEDHHDDEGGEHHHHLSFSGSVAMASVTTSSLFFPQLAINLKLTPSDEMCTSGPVFELIKPPQVG